MTTRRPVRRRAPAVRRQRPPTKWENLVFTHSHVAAASTVFSVLTPEPQQVDQLGTATLLTSIIHVDMVPSAVSAGAANTIQFGITVMTLDAIVALAFPDPSSDFQQSWYWWASRLLPVSVLEVITAIDVIIRSARKLRQGFGLAMISETPANPVAMTAQISMRNLWKTP